MRCCPLQELCFQGSHPLPYVLCTPRYKSAESQALVTLSADNLEAAWRQSKDNCLTVWCDITEVSDGWWWRPTFLPAPGKEPKQTLPLLSLLQAQACGFQSKAATS